ncbi:hypothetical protein [Paenibacillus tepidiphilus]|uniref:hypothetical protein n=1 Tax=Paenibacillus tepidiphilus TaxID=2608683 RepID=UPI00123C474A|nr:hypothetical protein [Paenibacillus tepidiphilus]
MRLIYLGFLMSIFLVACNPIKSIPPLSEQDFEVTYKDVLINAELAPDSIINKLGTEKGFEDNNYGLISQGNGYNRWGLNYPNKEDADISIIFLEDEIIFTQLNKIATHRGIKVGDSVDQLFEAYGNSELIKDSYIYELDTHKLQFYMSNDNKTVQRIYIDYNLDDANRKQGITA